MGPYAYERRTTALGNLAGGLRKFTDPLSGRQTKSQKQGFSGRADRQKWFKIGFKFAMLYNNGPFKNGGTVSAEEGLSKWVGKPVKISVGSKSGPAKVVNPWLVMHKILWMKYMKDRGKNPKWAYRQDDWKVGRWAAGMQDKWWKEVQTVMKSGNPIIRGDQPDTMTDNDYKDLLQIKDRDDVLYVADLIASTPAPPKPDDPTKTVKGEGSSEPTQPTPHEPPSSDMDSLIDQATSYATELLKSGSSVSQVIDRVSDRFTLLPRSVVKMIVNGIEFDGAIPPGEPEPPERGAPPERPGEPLPGLPAPGAPDAGEKFKWPLIAAGAVAAVFLWNGLNKG